MADSKTVSTYPRRIASLDGGEVTEGKSYFDLPAWFSRLGRKHFTIDTGFGTVTLKTVPIQENTLLDFAKCEGTACKVMLKSFVEIPEWTAEDKVVLDKHTVIEEGQPIPHPSKVAQMTPEACAKYVAECLPSSLVVQIMAAWRFMQLPPIAYTQADPD